jgi:hypothetical protein
MNFQKKDALEGSNRECRNFECIFHGLLPGHVSLISHIYLYLGLHRGQYMIYCVQCTIVRMKES